MTSGSLSDDQSKEKSSRTTKSTFDHLWESALTSLAKHIEDRTDIFCTVVLDSLIFVTWLFTAWGCHLLTVYLGGENNWTDSQIGVYSTLSSLGTLLIAISLIAKDLKEAWVRVFNSCPMPNCAIASWFKCGDGRNDS